MGSLMGHSSEDDTDVSDSETEEYVEKVYEELKSGKHQVKVSDQAYTCPYCPKKKKQDWQHKELVQHASGIGNSNSQKRTVKDKASHLALVKYLENDIASDGSGSGSSQPNTEVDTLADHDRDELFVWPWIGIVVNIRTEVKDGRNVGESGSKLRDMLTMRGFNPTRVRPLWNYQGHSGMATVEFHKDWSGFTNAMSFEKAYETSQHGKRHYFAKNGQKSDLYAWVAREDDYNANNIVGENLRKIGDLRTVSDIIEEEARKTEKLVGNLTNVIEKKEMHMLEIQNKFVETENSLRQLMGEKDKLHQAYNEEIKKIETSARDHFRKIFNDHEKLKIQLETQREELESRGQELKTRETHNEMERKKLAEDLEQNAVKNSSLQAATEEQRKADEKVFQLAEVQKKEKENLHRRIINLEKQIDAKQQVELDIEQLRGKLNVVKHMGEGDEGDMEVMKKVDSLLKSLREKEGELSYLEATNRALVAKERESNDELQEARKEMINVMRDLPVDDHIGIKRMGELDSKPFHDAMKRKYRSAEADEKALELCTLWEEYLRNPDWHPIKVVNIDGKDEAVIKEDDEKLRELRETYGEKVYKAVCTALFEINEYNPSGAYITAELWNYDKKRRAPLKEGVAVLLKEWDRLKRQKLIVIE